MLIERSIGGRFLANILPGQEIFANFDTARNIHKFAIALAGFEPVTIWNYNTPRKPLSHELETHWTRALKL